MFNFLRVFVLVFMFSLVLLNVCGCEPVKEPLAVENTVAKEIPGSTAEPAVDRTVTSTPKISTQPKKLNTLVTELLNMEYAWQDAGVNEYTFTNPRPGWVFMKMTAYVPYEGKVTTTLKTHDKITTISHEPAGKPTVKLMRYLPTGQYSLTIDIQKQCPIELTVRTVPELVFCKFRYEPLVSSFGPYDWGFLEKYYLDNINCIIGDQFVEKNKPLIDFWRGQGKKWIVEQHFGGDNMKKPLNTAGADGVILDELGNTKDKETVDTWAEAIEKAAKNGKLAYPYCCGIMNSEEYGKTFMQRVIDAGQMLAWEQYLIEKPTEAEAKENIREHLKEGLLKRKKKVPGCEKNILLVLGSELMMTAETFSVYPEVDWKVYIDMQHHLIANDPTFEGLGGIQHYTCGYTDEESLRWIAKLMHHYYIQGNTEMLSEKYGFKYELDHIANPDFADGTNDWNTQPAEEGSITTKQHKGYGKFQGRWAFKSDRGDTFLWTKRSPDKPNVISQQIKNLSPGKLYSVKVIVGDYNELKTGNSNMKMETGDYDELMKRKAMLKPHAALVSIDGAEIIEYKSFVEPAPSLYSSKLDNLFERKNRYTFNYHHKVFRAKDTTAELVISDWLTETEPGGPQGQELIYNFIEVQPYFEEER